jgi:hypothetical protein
MRGEKGAGWDTCCLAFFRFPSVLFSGLAVSQNCLSLGGGCARGTLQRVCGIDDGVGADSLDSASGCTFAIPGMWVVTDRDLRNSASSKNISETMLLRVGDLDDSLRIDDRADKLSERTWKVTAVVSLFRQS